MSCNKDFIRGVYPLIFVPYHDDGEVDYQTFEKELEYLSTKPGIHGLGLFGMVSEFHKLDDSEKFKLADIFVNGLKGTGVCSLVSVTDHSTEVAVKRAKYFEKLGPDTLMLLPPSFLNPDINEIRHHMTSVLEAVDIPVLIQYAPQATGKAIATEELVAMADKYDNAAFKIEYKPPVEYMREVFALSKDLVVLGGYAGIDIIEQYQIGVRGVMPGCSFTELYVAEYNAFLAGDIQKANEIHALYAKYLPTWMSSPESMMAIEKEIFVRRGLFKNGKCRRPAHMVTEKQFEELECFLEEVSAYCGKIC